MMYHTNDARDVPRVAWLTSASLAKAASAAHVDFGCDAQTLIRVLLTIRLIKAAGGLFRGHTVDPTIVPALAPFFRYINTPSGGTAAIVQVDGNLNRCSVKAAAYSVLANPHFAEGNTAPAATAPAAYESLGPVLAQTRLLFGGEQNRTRNADGSIPAPKGEFVRSLLKGVRGILDGYLVGTWEAQLIWDHLVEGFEECDGPLVVMAGELAESLAENSTLTNDQSTATKVGYILFALSAVLPPGVIVIAQKKGGGGKKRARVGDSVHNIKTVTVPTGISEVAKKVVAQLAAAAAARLRDADSKSVINPEAVLLNPTADDIIQEAELLVANQPATTVSMYAALTILVGPDVSLRVYELLPAGSIPTGQFIATVVGEHGKAVPVKEIVHLYHGPMVPAVSIAVLLSCWKHPLGRDSGPITGSANSETCCGVPHYSGLLVQLGSAKVGCDSALASNPERHALAVADVTKALLDRGPAGAANGIAFGLTALLPQGTADSATSTALADLQKRHGPRTFQEFSTMATALNVMAAIAGRAYLIEGDAGAGMQAFHTHICSMQPEEEDKQAMGTSISGCRLQALKRVAASGINLASILAYKGSERSQISARTTLDGVARVAFQSFLGPPSAAAEDAKDFADTTLFYLIIVDTFSRADVLEGFSQLHRLDGGGAKPLVAAAAHVGTDTATAEVAAAAFDAAAAALARAELARAEAANVVSRSMNGVTNGYLAFVAGDKLNHNHTAAGGSVRQSFSVQMCGFYRTGSLGPQHKPLAIENVLPTGPLFECSNCSHRLAASGAKIYTNAGSAFADCTLCCSDCRGDGDVMALQAFTDKHASLGNCDCSKPLLNAKKGSAVWVKRGVSASPTAVCETCYKKEVVTNLTDILPDLLVEVTLTDPDDASPFDTIECDKGRCWLVSRISGHEAKKPAGSEGITGSAGAGVSAGGNAPAKVARASSASEGGAGAGNSKASEVAVTGSVVSTGGSKRQRPGRSAAYTGMDAGSGGGSSSSSRASKARKVSKVCYFTGTAADCASLLEAEHTTSETVKTVTCLCCAANFCMKCFVSGSEDRWRAGTHRQVHYSGVDVYAPENYVRLVAAETATAIANGSTECADASMPTLAAAVKFVSETLLGDVGAGVRPLLAKICVVMCPGCTPQPHDFAKASPEVATAAAEAIKLYNQLLQAAATDLQTKCTESSLCLNGDDLIISTLNLVGENNVHGMTVELAVNLDTSTGQTKTAWKLWNFGLATLEENNETSVAQTAPTTGKQTETGALGDGTQKWIDAKEAEMEAIKQNIAAFKAAQKKAAQEVQAEAPGPSASSPKGPG